jgi:hypothetical protein
VGDLEKALGRGEELLKVARGEVPMPSPDQLHAEMLATLERMKGIVREGAGDSGQREKLEALGRLVDQVFEEGKP